MAINRRRSVPILQHVVKDLERQRTAAEVRQEGTEVAKNWILVRSAIKNLLELVHDNFDENGPIHNCSLHQLMNIAGLSMASACLHTVSPLLIHLTTTNRCNLYMIVISGAIKIIPFTQISQICFVPSIEASIWLYVLQKQRAAKRIVKREKREAAQREALKASEAVMQNSPRKVHGRLRGNSLDNPAPVPSPTPPQPEVCFSTLECMQHSWSRPNIQDHHLLYYIYYSINKFSAITRIFLPEVDAASMESIEWEGVWIFREGLLEAQQCRFDFSQEQRVFTSVSQISCSLAISVYSAVGCTVKAL